MIGEECRTGRLCINSLKVYAVSHIKYCLIGSLFHIHKNTETPVFPLSSFHQLIHIQSHNMIIQVFFSLTSCFQMGLYLKGLVFFRQHKERRPLNGSYLLHCRLPGLLLSLEQVRLLWQG
jgi:hypothetical protein